MRNEILVAYVPVVHRGYIDFFHRHEEAPLYILGESLLKDFPHIVRDMRAVSPNEAAAMAKSLMPGRVVEVIEADIIPPYSPASEIIMPDEEISHAVAQAYFPKREVTFERVFLRWDKKTIAALSKINPDHTVSREKFDQDVLGLAYKEAALSSDWWRQVGAVALRGGNILFAAHNAHAPSEHTPYIVGDPRSNFNAGESIELSSALHAEIGIISLAARKGVSLHGADLYISTFPCSGCARAVANAGFRRIFYAEGYSQIEGEQALRSRSVEIVRVDMAKPSSK